MECPARSVLQELGWPLGRQAGRTERERQALGSVALRCAALPSALSPHLTHPGSRTDALGGRGSRLPRMMVPETSTHRYPFPPSFNINQINIAIPSKTLDITYVNSRTLFFFLIYFLIQNNYNKGLLILSRKYKNNQ